MSRFPRALTLTGRQARAISAWASNDPARPMLTQIEVRQNGPDWFLIATDSFGLSILSTERGYDRDTLVKRAKEASITGYLVPELVDQMRKVKPGATVRITSESTMWMGEWRYTPTVVTLTDGRGRAPREVHPNWSPLMDDTHPVGIPGKVALGAERLRQLLPGLAYNDPLVILGQGGVQKPIHWEISTDQLRMVGMIMPVRL